MHEPGRPSQILAASQRPGGGGGSIGQAHLKANDLNSAEAARQNEHHCRQRRGKFGSSTATITPR